LIRQKIFIKEYSSWISFSILLHSPANLFIYLFISNIPKSTYRSLSSGYRNSERISNFALCNREPVTKIGSLE
jgi:hypothetical protein